MNDQTIKVQTQIEEYEYETKMYFREVPASADWVNTFKTYEFADNFIYLMDATNKKVIGGRVVNVNDPKISKFLKSTKNNRNGILLSRTDDMEEFISEFALSSGLREFLADRYVFVIVRPKASLANPVFQTVELKRATNGVAFVDPITGKLATSTKQKKRLYRRYKLRNDVIQPIPYEYFDETNDQSKHSNCLLNFLLKKYDKPKDNKAKISPKSIRNFFIYKEFNRKETTENTSIERLIEFIIKYRIHAKIMDILGRPIFDSIDGTDSDQFKGEPTKRPRIIGIVYDNHFYPYTKVYRTSKDGFKLVKKASFTDEKITVPGVNDQLPNDFAKALSVCNWTYESEDNMFPRALMNVYGLPSDHTFTPEDFIQFDMNKSYYSVMNDKNNQHLFIPSFSCIDLIEPYNNEKIKSHYLYCLKDLPNIKKHKQLYEYGFHHNCMHGFVVKKLMNLNLIDKSDITHVKKSSYKIQVSEVKKILTQLQAKYDITDENIKSKYPMYNGILGMRRTSSQFKSVKTNKAIEIELLNKLSNNDQSINSSYKIPVVPQDNEEPGRADQDSEEYVYSSYRKTKFKYFNTRNVYNFCVDLANLFMLEQMSEIKKNNNNAIIYRVCVDSFTILRSCLNRDNPANDILNVRFKDESHKITIDKMNNGHVTDIFNDGCDIFINSRSELKELTENVKLISGAPGSGKSHLVKNNHNYRFAITTSNFCTQNQSTQRVKATTTTKFFSKYDFSLIYDLVKHIYNSTIWADEPSMFSPDDYSLMLITMALGKTKYILTGDFNQIGPIETGDYDYSTDFFRIFYRNTEILDTQYRANTESGKVVVDLWSSIYKGLEKNYIGQYQLPKRNTPQYDEYKEKILSTMEEYEDSHPIEYLDEIKVHLTATNNYRHFMNNYVLEKQGKAMSVVSELTTVDTKIKKPDGTFKKRVVNTIKAEITAGVRLSARVKDNRFGITKGEIFETLHDITPDNRDDIQLKRIKLDDPDYDETITIPYNIIAIFDAGYAFTYHSSQGLTIKEPYVCHEYDAAFNYLSFNVRLLYTGLSRGTCEEHLFLQQCNDGYDANDRHSSRNSIISGLENIVKEQYKSIKE